MWEVGSIYDCGISRALNDQKRKLVPVRYRDRRPRSSIIVNVGDGRVSPREKCRAGVEAGKGVRRWRGRQTRHDERARNIADYRRVCRPEIPGEYRPPETQRTGAASPQPVRARPTREPQKPPPLPVHIPAMTLQPGLLPSFNRHTRAAWSSIRGRLGGRARETGAPSTPTSAGGNPGTPPSSTQSPRAPSPPSDGRSRDSSTAAAAAAPSPSSRRPA